MKMETDAIVPGKAIAGFQLGCSVEELREKIDGKAYSVEHRVDTTVFHCGDFSFFVSDRNRKLFQIAVGQGFNGRFLGRVGIGSTLRDVENHIGKWAEELDVYVLPQWRGICFELSDSGTGEEWREDEMPIEWISVYDMAQKGDA